MSFSLDTFFGTTSIVKIAELHEKIKDQEVFNLKDTGVPYRSFLHWESQNLLFSEVGKPGKPRTLTFVEFVWVQVIHELRTMGVGIPLIQQLKANLFEDKISLEDLRKLILENQHILENIPSEEERQIILGILDESQIEESDKVPVIPIFEMFLSGTITQRIPISLFVFNDGSFLPWIEGKSHIYTKDDLEKKTYETYVSVSLSRIVKNFLYDESLEYVLPKLPLFEPNEMKLLEIVNSGDYEAITVNFKNKKMKSVEMVKSQHVKKKIVDIIRENAYQDIEIKTHKGMVTTIKNTVKLQFD